MVELEERCDLSLPPLPPATTSSSSGDAPLGRGSLLSTYSNGSRRERPVPLQQSRAARSSATPLEHRSSAGGATDHERGELEHHPIMQEPRSSPGPAQVHLLPPQLMQAPKQEEVPQRNDPRSGFARSLVERRNDPRSGFARSRNDPRSGSVGDARTAAAHQQQMYYQMQQSAGRGVDSSVDHPRRGGVSSSGGYQHQVLQRQQAQAFLQQSGGGQQPSAHDVHQQQWAAVHHQQMAAAHQMQQMAARQMHHQQMAASNGGCAPSEGGGGGRLASPEMVGTAKMQMHNRPLQPRHLEGARGGAGVQQTIVSSCEGGVMPGEPGSSSMDTGCGGSSEDHYPSNYGYPPQHPGAMGPHPGAMGQHHQVVPGSSYAGGSRLHHQPYPGDHNMQRHHAAAQAQEQQARLQAREQHRVRYGPEPPNAPEPYRVDQRLDQERWEVPDRYKIIRVIGTGSYGKVCQAQDMDSKKMVAIKKVKRVFDDLVDCKRLLREIAILSELEDERVVRVLDVHIPGDPLTFNEIYLVLELCDSDLKKLFRLTEYLEESHIATIMFNTLCGLKYLHSAGIFHRDLKPANCLVLRDCMVKICDFGLARPVVRSGEENSLTGIVVMDAENRSAGLSKLTGHVVTRWYRAPELILLQETYNEQIDMWSLGCIFGELLGMLQENFPNPRDRGPLFQGSTCYPLSPHREARTDYQHYYCRQSKDQLNLIFDIVGTPDFETIERLDKDDAKRYVRCFKERSHRSFEEMDRFRATTPEALDLLSQMLKLCPKKRINVDKALEHPFFPKAMGTLFDASKIRTAPGRISLGFESLDIANGHVKPSQRNVLSAQLRVHFLLQVSKFRPVSIPPQLVEQIPEGARFVSRARTEMENSSQALKRKQKAAEKNSAKANDSEKAAKVIATGAATGSTTATGVTGTGHSTMTGPVAAGGAGPMPAQGAAVPAAAQGPMAGGGPSGRVQAGGQGSSSFAHLQQKGVQHRGHWSVECDDGAVGSVTFGGTVGVQ